jgi:hypothetical protein
MARVIKLGKEDKLSSRIWNGATAEDISGVMFVCTLGGVVAGFLTSLWVLSWFLALWAVPLIFFGVTAICYGRNSEWIRGGSLFIDARNNYKNLIDDNSISQAKVLLDNVHRHQVAFQNSNKDHQSRYDCRDCYRRVQLINELYENQALPELDNSDIERVQLTLAARKEMNHEIH